MRSILFLAGLTTASLVGSASAAVDIGYVAIGNPGNAGDAGNFWTPWGQVNYNYAIAKNETTIVQYTEFLNAVAKTDTYGLYNGSMATDQNSSGSPLFPNPLPSSSQPCWVPVFSPGGGVERA